MNKYVALFLAIVFFALMPCTVEASFKKTKIAIIDFRVHGQEFAKDDMGQIIAEWLTTAFVQEGRFEVIERQMLRKVLSEQKLVMSGFVDESSATEIGKLLGVNVIITGSVMKIQDSIAVNSRIIEVESASIIAAEFINSPSTVELRRLIGEMAIKIVKNFPINGYIVERNKQTVLIDLGKRAGVTKGMQFIAYEEGAKVTHPKTGEILDIKKIEKGIIEITKVDFKVSRGQIITEKSPGAIKYSQLIKNIVEPYKPNLVQLYLNTDPQKAGVKILIDNVEKNYVHGMDLVPGRYLVTISASGYETKQQYINVSELEKVANIFVRLDKYRAPAPAVEVKARKQEKIATLQNTITKAQATSPEVKIISNVKGAKIFFLKNPYSPGFKWVYKGRTPYVTKELESGNHTIKVTKFGYYTAKTTIMLDFGEKILLHADLKGKKFGMKDGTGKIKVKKLIQQW